MVLWWVIGAGAGIASLWGVHRYIRHRAEFGTGLERVIERWAGLGGIRKKLRRVQDLTNAKKREGRLEEVKAERNQAKKRPVGGAITAEKIEESAEALNAIGGRAEGLIAGLKLLEQAIENYVQSESQEESKEEKEFRYINGLIGRIGETVNYNKIDSLVVSYLKKYINNLLVYLRAEVGTEEEKERDMRKLIMRLREVIAEMKQILNEAKTEEGIFKKFERKERKDYSRDIRDLAKLLKSKKEELKKIRRGGRRADNSMIANLEREIVLMEKQHALVSRLSSRLKLTFKMMDKKAKGTRRIIKRLREPIRNINRTERTINTTESRIEKKFRQIRESFEKLEKSIGHFRFYNNIHLIAFSISEELNDFLKKNKDLGLVTSQFDKSLRNITTLGFEMSGLTVMYERMIKDLTDSEKAVNQGMEVLIKVMNSVISDSETQINETEVANTLEQLKQLLDYEEKTEIYLSNLATAIEYKLRGLLGLIDRLAEEDMRIVNYVEVSSRNLREVMTVAVDRKIAVSKKYMVQALQSERQLS